MSEPPDAVEPVFSAPWQAQAFAMTLSLYEHGVFTWSEWAAALAAEIRRAQRVGDAERGDTYYRDWLAALEALLAAKGVTTSRELARYQRAWHKAAERTPHGAPIVLIAADLQA
jgi:nitrile hydratase accessory protein